MRSMCDRTVSALPKPSLFAPTFRADCDRWTQSRSIGEVQSVLCFVKIVLQQQLLDEMGGHVSHEPTVDEVIDCRLAGQHFLGFIDSVSSKILNHHRRDYCHPTTGPIGPSPHFVGNP